MTDNKLAEVEQAADRAAVAITHFILDEKVELGTFPDHAKKIITEHMLPTISRLLDAAHYDGMVAGIESANEGNND